VSRGNGGKNGIDVRSKIVFRNFVQEDVIGSLSMKRWQKLQVLNATRLGEGGKLGEEHTSGLLFYVPNKDPQI
jgi:hypothetical protein